MTLPSWMNGPPKRLLLATDLSPRCDRALDRAAAVAAQWQSALVALHVLEKFELGTLEAAQLPSWRRPPDPYSLAQKHLLADMGAVSNRATVLIAEGDPAETILRTAETEQCDLIVIGIARDELLGRLSLGRTVDRLLRRARVPLLVVKGRPRGPYRHIVVAIDFSDSSRHTLEAAARFFPEQKLTVFHAYNAPMPRARFHGGNFAAYRREYGTIAARELETFLERVNKPPTWQPPHVLIEDGSPTFLLREYVREKDVDLVVLGTHGRSAISEIFIGSTAKAIMDEAPCDALLIREPHAAVES
jgi:nucleotide-binding universal stress UspA family protein